MIDDGRPIGYDPENQPPPPNLAQSLVSRSGFTVYEAGSTLFDQPVLVYVMTERIPEFVIHDHVGRRLGSTATDRLTWGRRIRRIGDAQGSTVLTVRRNSGFPVDTFRVAGAATGSILRSTSGFELQGGSALLGTVRGSGLWPHSGSSFQIVDGDDRSIGAIRGYRQFKDGMLDVYSYAMSIEPGLRGPLRSMLPAVPTVLALSRSYASER